MREAPSFTQLEVGAQPGVQARAEGHKAAFAELGVADLKHVTFEIHVAALQAGDLADTQSQPGEKREDGLVGRTSERTPPVVGQSSRLGQHPLNGLGVEQHRRTPGCFPARSNLQWRRPQHLLVNDPFEQTPHDAQ